MNRIKMNRIKKRRKKMDKPYLMWALICVTVAGISALAVFIIKDGWDKFLSWFTSPYASIIYIALAIYLAVVIFFFVTTFGSKEVDTYVDGK